MASLILNNDLLNKVPELTEPANNTNVLVNVGIPPTAPPPGKIFSCGWNSDNLREYWFPKYEYAGICNASTATSPEDIMLVGMHGPGMSTRQIEKWFRGKALFFNGEAHGRIPFPRNRLYQVGGPVNQISAPT
jgi:hypothetical protein